jgi:hypothetical protein
MSVHAAQPLIWLARILTSCWVVAGRLELVSTAPAELMCFAMLAPTVVSRRLSRASMVISFAVVEGYTLLT